MKRRQMFDGANPDTVDFSCFDEDGNFSKELWQKKQIHDIEEEVRRRKEVQKKNHVLVDPMDRRTLGTQDMTDYDTRIPFQKEALDRCGEIIPINTDWRCTKCGQMYNAPVPPPKCIRCGHQDKPYDRFYLNMHR